MVKLLESNWNRSSPFFQISFWGNGRESCNAQVREAGAGWPAATFFFRWSFPAGDSLRLKAWRWWDQKKWPPLSVKVKWLVVKGQLTRETDWRGRDTWWELGKDVHVLRTSSWSWYVAVPPTYRSANYYLRLSEPDTIQVNLLEFLFENALIETEFLPFPQTGF